MSFSNCSWKPNWEESRNRYLEWWQGRGLLIGMWGNLPATSPHEILSPPDRLDSLGGEAYRLAGAERACIDHYRLAHRSFPLDILPVLSPDLGPGSLCLHLGGKADFSRDDTIWFHPVLSGIDDVEDIPEFRFCSNDAYWQSTEAYLKEAVQLAEGRYLVGFPDLCHDLDVLAALRDPNQLLLDLIEEPEWVHQSLDAINAAYLECYQRILAILDPDGTRGTASEVFYIWGPGKTAKLQCDTSAMISTEMFEEFVVPRLARLAGELDHVLYHLDGTDALRHLDTLLAIDGIDVIQWTPEAGKPGGADPIWHDLYRKILAAGKSVQIVYLKSHEVAGLTRSIGTEGMYIMPEFESLEEALSFKGP